jgi:hypothetical protein
MRQDVYRVAYDEAHSELIDISKRFEDLRRRKDSLESVVMALAPMLGVALPTVPTQATVGIADPSAAAPQAPAEQGDYSLNQAPAAPADGDESITDPFQRRVRNALKFSSNNNGHEHKGLQPAV